MKRFIIFIILIILFIGGFLWFNFFQLSILMDNTSIQTNSLAKNSSSILFCYSLVNSSQRDSCYFGVGVFQRNLSVCSMIDDFLKAGDCVMLVKRALA